MMLSVNGEIKVPLNTVNIRDRFENFDNFVSIERCSEIIDQIVKRDLIKFKTNALGNHKDNYTSDYHMNKKRAMLCSQLSKLAFYMIGQGTLSRSKSLVINGAKTTHTMIILDDGSYLDYTISQLEGIPFKLDPVFKPLRANIIDGMYQFRSKGLTSQKLKYKVPTRIILNNIEMLTQEFNDLYFLNFWLLMEHEFKQKLGETSIV